ncbi:MAG TPA: hypothetical protein VF505_04295 [Thermoanaerobaculia bacterium]
MIVLSTIYQIIDGFLDFILIAILVWVILSWISAFSQRSSARWRYRRIFSFLETIEHFLRVFLSPMLRLARKIVPQRIMPREWAFLDLSPLILSILIILLRAVLAWAFSRILFSTVTGG